MIETRELILSEEQESYKPQTSVIEKNFKWIVAVVVLGLLAGGGNAVYKSQLKKQEQEAYSKLYSAQKVYLEKKEAFQKESLVDLQKKPGDKTETKKTKTGDLTKDFGEVVTQLKSFIDQNPGKQATAQAAFYLFEIHKDYEKLGEAVDSIRTALKGMPEGLTTDLLQMTLGNSLAESDQCDEAVTHYQKVLYGKTIKYLKSEAGLRAGLCLEKMKQMDRALDMYQKAIDADPESQIAKTAEKYLRVLKTQTNQSNSVTPAKETSPEGQS